MLKTNFMLYEKVYKSLLIKKKEKKKKHIVFLALLTHHDKFRTLI